MRFQNIWIVKKSESFNTESSASRVKHTHTHTRRVVLVPLYASSVMGFRVRWLGHVHAHGRESLRDFTVKSVAQKTFLLLQSQKWNCIRGACNALFHVGAVPKEFKTVLSFDIRNTINNWLWFCSRFFS